MGRGSPPPRSHHLTMHRRLLLSRLAALGLALPAAARPQAGRGYGFSPVNQYGVELTARYWNPVLEHVSRRSGVPLRLKLGRTSADTIAYVLANEVDFSFNNHLFSPEREKLGWTVFGRRSSPALRGQIVVLADAPQRTLEDLRDLEVAFPGPEAVIAYKFTYAALLARKVPVRVVFGGNHDGAFGMLLSGRAKAIGVNSQVAEGWTRREGHGLRVLWESEPVPELALMSSSRVLPSDLAAVQKAFLGMHLDPEGRGVLAAASEAVKLPKDTHFVGADANDFRPYRDFYRNAPPSLR